MKSSVLAACVVCLLSPAAFGATIIESFSGTGALVTPGNTGDHTGNTYTITVTETVGCAEITFDVSVSVGGGPVHFDTRGFGDSGSTNDSFQTTPAPAETMTFTIGSVTATALAGATLVNNGVTVEFTSFDLVNNGGNPPAVDWTTDIATSGTTTAPAGSVSPDITSESGVAGSTNIDFTGSNAWMWINNGQFSYSGDVTVDKIPEPSATILGLLGSIALLRRRR